MSISGGVAPSRPTLRPFQAKAKAELWANIREGVKRNLLQSATGSGKGTIAADITMSASTAQRSVLFLVNRKAIVNDFSARLDRLGVDHGIIMGSNPRRRPWLHVHVASIDTIHRREKLPKADLIFIDEARFCLSEIWLKTLARYEDVPVIGMDATPVRLDGRGLGEVFDAIVRCPSVQELTDMGYLVPARVFAPSPPPDLKGVTTSAGDYNQKQLAAIVDRPKLTGDCVKHWLKFGENRPTINFSVNVEHSKHTVEEFLRAGVAAEHVDADTPDDERNRIWERSESGRTKVICSVRVVSYGADLPWLSCAIMNAPTQSLALWLQELGRVLRTFPQKSDSIILDHAGGTLVHGFAEDDREWSLDGFTRKKKGAAKDDGPGVRMCAKCWRAFTSRLDACPGCGFTYRVTKEIRIAEGELQELKREAKLKSKEEYFGSFTIEQRFQKYAEFREKAEERNYKHGWAPMQYRQTFGEYPPNVFRQQYRDLKSAGQPEAVSA